MEGLVSTNQLVADLLLDLYPGNDTAIVRIREELARVSAIPGPVGYAFREHTLRVGTIEVRKSKNPM